MGEECVMANAMKVTYDPKERLLRGETDFTLYEARVGEELDGRGRHSRVRFEEVIDGQCLVSVLDGKDAGKKRLYDEDAFVRDWGRVVQERRPTAIRDLGAGPKVPVSEKLDALLVEARETNRLLRLLLEAWGAHETVAAQNGSSTSKEAGCGG
jgi:hypothetical protein